MCHKHRRMKVDGWMIKKREDQEPIPYRRLDGDDESAADHVGFPKGYVPELVGSERRMERFFIHTKLFKHPSILTVLEMAEEEFGYEQPGILKIPCDVEYFQRVMELISSSKAK